MNPHARQGRVASVALDRLRADGLAGTSLDDVARAGGFPDAEVRACFGDMEALLGHLVSPLLCRLEELVTSAAASDRQQAPQVRHLIEGYFDTVVAHAGVVGLALGDPSASSSGAVRRVRDHIGRLRTELAGGAGADLDHTIRAASALAAVHAGVLELTDVEQSVVREVVIGAAVAILLSAPGMVAASRLE